MTLPRRPRTAGRPRLARRVFLGGAFLAVATAGAWADTVTLIDGTTFKQGVGGAVRGTVQSESTAEVVVQVGASTVKVPVDQIAHIEYSGQPASIQLGESRQASGQYAEAVVQYKKGEAEAAGKPFIVQLAQFHEADALAEQALIEPERMKEAKDRLAAFVQAHPSSRHVAAVRDRLARLQMNTDDFDGAEANVAALAKLPNASERAAILKAKVLARRGDHAGAVAELDKLAASLPDGSPQQREAKLAKAESLVGGKKFKEAEELVRQVIAAAPAEDFAAQSLAYNTLGDCLRAASRPRDAVLAYLHTDLLYSKDKQEHPKALYQLERLFRQLGNAPRADEFSERLKKGYPRSPWANVPADASKAS